MNTAGRLGAFGLAALVSLAGGAAIGAAVGPIDPAPSGAHDPHEGAPMSTTAISPHTTGHRPTSTAAGAYRLDAAPTIHPAGEARSIAFRILDGSDAVVTKFEERHERPMHLIVVSADATRYAHLHPRVDTAGTWTVDLPALEPGGYRLIADTAPTGGPDLVLPWDLIVPGPTPVRPIPEPTTTAALGDLDVDLDLGAGTHGLSATLTVRRNGAAIVPDPYLGARGHLVAIALDDLAYLHVHPEAGGDAPLVKFAIADPQSGRYRLFFDFSVDGTVRTAAFTVDMSTGEGHR